MACILVIDDEPAIRGMIERILQSADHEAVLAENGAAGLEAQKREPVELAIVDLIMPRKEGIETIRELRAISPEMPIIAISGGGRLGNVDLLSVARRLGADSTLAKPFSPDELLETVAELLA